MMLAIVLAYSIYSINVYGTRWFAYGRNTRVLSDKNVVIPGKIVDRNGVVLAYTDNTGNRQYQQDKTKRSAVVHLIGDNQNQVSNGVEKFQARYLYGFDTSLSERIEQFINGKQRYGDDIQITVDSELNTYIVNKFNEDKDLRDKGAGIVVMNYKTGEIVSLVSMPVFDPVNIPQSAFTDVRRPFWNRVTQSTLPPGSTYKIITMASALQFAPELANSEFNCDGAIFVNNHTIKDANAAVHGPIKLQKAFEVSCNNTFAKIALSLGDEKLSETSEALGFNDNFLFRDIVVENSVYPYDGRNDLEMALSGIGQSKILATPMHMCMIASAVANDGVMMEPYLLNKVVSHGGTERTIEGPREYRKVLDNNIIKPVYNAMLGVVKNGTGKRAAVTGMNIAGKTGSAEGMVNGKEATHAWFVGFSANNDTPYALCIMVEGGGGGGSVAAPLASQIFAYLKARYK